MDDLFDSENCTVHGVDVSECTSYEEVIETVAEEQGGEPTAFSSFPHVDVDRTDVEKRLREELDEERVREFLAETSQ